jgi:hypothetical protein
MVTHGPTKLGGRRRRQQGWPHSTCRPPMKLSEAGRAGVGLDLRGGVGWSSSGFYREPKRACKSVDDISFKQTFFYQFHLESHDIVSHLVN